MEVTRPPFDGFEVSSLSPSYFGLCTSYNSPDLFSRFRRISGEMTPRRSPKSILVAPSRRDLREHVSVLEAVSDITSGRSNTLCCPAGAKCVVRTCVRASRTRRRNWKAAHVPRGRAGTYLPMRELRVESLNYASSRSPSLPLVDDEHYRPFGRMRFASDVAREHGAFLS